MKTIIYALLAIMLFGSIASGYMRKPYTQKIIRIESVENDVSTAQLSQSAEIISARLKDFSSEPFSIALNPAKHQIKVTLSKEWNLNVVRQLLTQKGELAFYPSYDAGKLAELLNKNDGIFSLVHKRDTSASDIIVGCAGIAQIGKVDHFIHSSGMDMYCKFSWGMSNNDTTELCLYALCPLDAKQLHLSETNVEDMHVMKDEDSAATGIRIDFKSSASGIWADMTRQNIGKPIAFVLDDLVVSAPVVRDEIKGGSCQITGNYSEKQLRYIAAVGNNGALPLDFKIVQ